MNKNEALPLLLGLFFFNLKWIIYQDIAETMKLYQKTYSKEKFLSWCIQEAKCEKHLINLILKKIRHFFYFLKEFI